MSDRSTLYDLALRPWKFSGVTPVGSEPIYTNEKLGAYRLSKYLFSTDQLEQIVSAKPMMVHVSTKEVVGRIVGIDLLRSLWIIEIDGEIEIFPGKDGYKPVAYQP